MFVALGHRWKLNQVKISAWNIPTTKIGELTVGTSQYSSDGNDVVHACVNFSQNNIKLGIGTKS